MRNLMGMRRALWAGVLFFAATSALCVVAEAQNQRAGRPARRPAASNKPTTPTNGGEASGPGVARPGSSAPKASSVPGVARPGSSAPKASSGPGVAERDEADEETSNKTSSAETSSDEAEGADAQEGKAGSGEKLTSNDKEESDDKLDELLAATRSNSGEYDERYSNEPLDPAATTLPPKYRGHNIETVYWAVEDIFEEGKVLKDEYEKTVDYIERIETFKKALPEKKLYGNLTFGSTLAIALTQNAEDPSISASCRYNADAEEFTLSFGSRVNYDLWRYSGPRYYGVRFVRELLSSETYIGKNGFGIEKKVEKTRYWSCGIAHTDSVDMELGSAKLFLQGVAPEEAKTMGDSLGVLCVFKLGYLEKVINGALTPYAVVGGWTSLEPTMDYPYDMFESKRALCATLPEFWVYNFDTGEVYAKYSLKDVKTGKSKKTGDFTVGPLNGKKGQQESETKETDEEKAEREARLAVGKFSKARRTAVVWYQDGNRRLENRLGAVKQTTPSREIDAPLTLAVPGDFATLQEALAEAAKAPYNGPIPRVVLDAGEYDASGLTIKTFVDIHSATGKPEDVVLSVDAAAPIVVDGETVVEFDGVTLRQTGDGAKAGACVEIQRGIALFFNCVLEGKRGAKSTTAVKAVGLKSAVVFGKCRATGFSLTTMHVEDGAFGWATESVFGPKNRFGASSKNARLEAEKCEFRGNDVGVYFGRGSTGGAQENVYAENQRDAQVVDGAKVEVDAEDAGEKEK